MPTVSLPTPLRPYADKQAQVDISGHNIGEVLDNLTERYPDLRKHLFTDDGALRSFVNVFVNDEDIRFLQKRDTAVNPSDEINIIPSIAGGLA